MQKIKLTNSQDEKDVRRGQMTGDQIRSVEIEALVDTGATMLMLPSDVVTALGLLPDGYRKVRYADGRVTETPG